VFAAPGPVVVSATGPGAANTLGAVGEAFASRSDVLVIATDIPTTLRRPGVYRGVLHETRDQAAMFAPVVRRSFVVRAAHELGEATRSAVLPHGGPAYLEVPTDLLSVDAGTPPPTAASARDASGGGLDGALAALRASERPLIWAGGGARDDGAAVAALAERLAAPVIETYGARGLLPPGHPCRVGMPPHVEPVGRLWDEADLVIAIGSDLDGMSTQNWAQPQPPALIAINPDEQDATKNYRADFVLDRWADRCSDLARELPARDGLPALAERLRGVRAEACRTLDPRALRFLDAFAHAVPEDAVVLADMCIPGYWLAGFHPFQRTRTLQYPVGWGTLGYAFPASLGAALAGAGPVVSVSGDGGFLFAAGELATVAQEKLPLTTVIVDDGGYGMLRYDQELAGDEPFGVDLRSPDFVALARSFGVKAEGVDDLDDAFGEALSRHMDDPAPSVLVARAPALVPPPTTSPNWYRRRR